MREPAVVVPIRVQMLSLIATGTPGGVGIGMKPPKLLVAGDVVRIEIDGLGVEQDLQLVVVLMHEVERALSPPGGLAPLEETRNREAPIRARRAADFPRGSRRPNRQVADTDRLVVLLSRLEDISARLETVAGTVAEPAQVENPQTPAESPLKEQSGAVEYVFRAAGG